MVKQPPHSADVVIVVALVIAVAGIAATSSGNPPEEAPAADTKSKQKNVSTPEALPKPRGAKDFKKELFSGKVVLAQEALKKRGIKVAEEMKSQAVLESDSGELFPIAADWRGRAFYQDKRLRNRKVDLVGYRRPGIPYLQVLVIYVVDKQGHRQKMDYWCDVCSIPMYEIKPCECCQDETRLRFRDTKLPEYLTRPERKSTQPGGKPAE